MARLRITYRNGQPPAEVSVGAFAQIAAKRRYGVEAITGEHADPEAGLFSVFVEIVGPKVAADVNAFDEWLLTVEDMEPADNGAPADDDPADPTPAESSASSPPSPPT